MTSALITGRLHGEPTTRPTRNGGMVTFLKLKVVDGNRIDYWSVATFSDSAREELEGLGDGDAISAVGSLEVEIFDWNGEKRINRKLTADRILALKPVSKAAKSKTDAPRDQRAKKSPADSAPLLDRGGREFDDQIPF